MYICDFNIANFIHLINTGLEIVLYCFFYIPYECIFEYMCVCLYIANCIHFINIDLEILLYHFSVNDKLIYLL